MALTDCSTFKLIELIRGHPCIWDPRCPDYCNRDIAREAKIQMCRDMGDIINDAECYKGWVHFGSSCYSFGEESVSWEGASTLCNNLDSTLAEVESAEENEFLKKHARSKSFKAMWLGGTDTFSEGYWLWDGSKNPVGEQFSGWAPGEPSHEGCLQLFKPLGYAWNNAPCNLTYPFVCEVKLEDGPEMGR